MGTRREKFEEGVSKEESMERGWRQRQRNRETEKQKRRQRETEKKEKDRIVGNLGAM